MSIGPCPICGKNGGRIASFSPTAGTQCLSRLRRAHSAFHAYGVPYASKPQGFRFSLYGGSYTEASESLHKKRGKIPPSHLENRGGRTASSRAYGVPYTSKPQRCRFLLHRGSSTEASESLCQSKKREIPPFPHRIWKTAADAQRLSHLRRSLQKQNARRLLSAPQGKHKKAQPWETPGLGLHCL